MRSMDSRCWWPHRAGVVAAHFLGFVLVAFKCCVMRWLLFFGCKSGYTFGHCAIFRRGLGLCHGARYRAHFCDGGIVGGGMDAQADPTGF